MFTAEMMMSRQDSFRKKQSNKSIAFDKLLLSLIPESPESPEPETCTSCGEIIGNFWDGVSQREYEQSGRCQDCQDCQDGE